MNKLLVSLLITTSLFTQGCTLMNNQEEVCSITGKESVHTKDASQYRVYTSCGTFVVEDSLLIFRFTSADTYGDIKINSKYSINHGGFRVGFISMFPNIISYKEVK